MATVKSSDTGIATHTPVRPKAIGKKISPISRKANVFINVIKPEFLPSLNAVNIADVNRFMPMNTNEVEAILRPRSVIA